MAFSHACESCKIWNLMESSSFELQVTDRHVCPRCTSTFLISKRIHVKGISWGRGGGGGGGGGANSIAIYKPRTAIIYVARGGRTAVLGICTAIINIISYNLTFSLMFH